MSRAFGDFLLKDHGIIAIPEISYRRLTARDQFIVLATDGVISQTTECKREQYFSFKVVFNL